MYADNFNQTSADEKKVLRYGFLLLHVNMWRCRLPFFCSEVFLNRLEKYFSVSFFGLLHIRQLLAVRHVSHTGNASLDSQEKSGDRFNHFVHVDVTCHPFWRKITKVSKQGYKITLNLCSSVQVTFRCVCAWTIWHVTRQD